jgi:hypothetical protein
MLFQEQRRLFEEMFENERSLLEGKGREYSNDADCLANFKDCDSIGLDPKQKLWVYLSKHLSSISSYIKNGKEFSDEPIEGRIADARNYLALLYMLIYEQKNAQPTKVCKCEKSKLESR